MGGNDLQTRTMRKAVTRLISALLVLWFPARERDPRERTGRFVRAEAARERQLVR